MYPGQAPDPLDPLSREAVLTALRRDRKIEAIKIYRGATGAGLRQAKAAVEAIAFTNGIAPAPARPNAPATVLVVAILVCVLVAIVATLRAAGH